MIKQHILFFPLPMKLLTTALNSIVDAFARVIVTNQAQETFVVEKTRSPTWDRMLKFEGIELWGDPEEFAVNPPVIVIEVFDKDEEMFGGVS